MSEEIIPEVINTSDVPERVESTVNYSEMNLAELSELFAELNGSEDKLKRSKEAEAIKAAFYKRLLKEKSENPVEEGEEHPLNPVEQAFKSVYEAYKKERAAYTAQVEAEREKNLEKKEAVIAELKALIENQENVGAAFPEFRKLQDRWREIGQVPAKNYEDINKTYQHCVELFYDMVNVNRELRDLDFQKNLEAKQQFCEMAEKLSENENIIEAFKELQKLHEQWKEFGPVAKQYRDEIWDRFKAATAVVNKKYQAYFEGLKSQQEQNLVQKSALCEQVEAIAEKEITSSNEWNSLSKEIEDIQKVWKTIGFASKKDNQKIYDRFRAACDKFYERKRVFYNDYKDNMNTNLEKKVALCEAAEQLKTSTEWKKTTDQFINLQKQWKEIGAVPRKKSEVLWKRFRAACDDFFAERDKNAKPENDFYGNLKAKNRLIEEIKAYELVEDENENMEAMTNFMQRWQAIGFVPFKEKEKVAQAYKEALSTKFPDMSTRSRKAKLAKSPKSERERLVQKYNKLEQDIVTYENNIGFFAMSKNSEPLIKQMQDRIAQAKEELKTLEAQIRTLDETEAEN
jgi:hypothetical protein